uniref:CSON008460 protein n=1 Tax=Culicoides sonorensis TaxID=179676 RepID=A0A336K245_CULSO
MASIHDLCDELLEQIFESLFFLERINCKSVCKRWLHLLMTSTKFQKDRHLYLKNCFIESNRPPMSVILNSKYTYEIVTIVNNNREMFYNKFKDLKDFWKFLGQSLVELNVEDIDYSCFELLTEMDNLKKVKYRNFSSLINNLEIMERKGKKLNQIRVLQLGKIDLKILGDNIEIIRKIMPSLQEITSELIFFNEQGTLHQYSPLFMSLNLFIADIHGINEILKQDMLEYTGPNIKLLDFHATEDLNLLKRALETHPKISEIHLACKIVPGGNFTKITKLIISLNKFECLEQLTDLVNLKSMELECKYKGCSFGHSALHLPSLKSLVIKWRECKCQECFHSLTDSFRNLKQLELCHHQGNIDQWVIQLMLRNWKLLEKLKLASMPCDYTLADALPYTESPRPYLKHFHLGSAIQLNVDSFLKLLCICPELRSLSFVFEGIDVKLTQILQIILPQFKKLNFLHIYSNPNSTLLSTIDHQDFISSIQHITEHGKSLRALTLPTVQDINEDSILDLFEHLEQINQFECINIEQIGNKRNFRRVAMNRRQYNEFLLDLSLPGVYFSKK